MTSSEVLAAARESARHAGELLQTFNGVSKIEMAQAALLRLVNLEPRELCSEAIIEKCRATRDLRNCGRTIQHVLTSCGHASLCAECGQRCDVCPICRVSIRRSEPTMRLRLYEECLEAGLIPSRDDDIRERDGHLNTDVQRLWSFFDVALEHKLISLVSHYVSDVCMDDGAVSSNAIISMLLDGKIVKEWCKRTFLHITRSLRDIYNVGAKQMQRKMSALEKFSTKLSGLARVLESLEGGPTADATSAPVLELQQLTEGVQRVSQHLEVICWCARHRFLENFPSCHSTINNWRTAVRGRKLAARNRAWPDHLRNTSQGVSGHSATLFIEDAMSNVGYGKDQEDDFSRDNPELGFLRQGMGISSASLRRREASGVQSAVQGSAVVYPPESMHIAVNLLFFEASSDLFLAKKAIFLYYLFDRYWPHCDGEYWTIVHDYMRSFDIPRNVMLESLLFYLLDNNNDMALQEACHLLPEILSCRIHPKVARVLLERQRPDAALDVLRCSSQDGNLRLSGSVSEPGIPDVVDAVTAIRARLECGLLTEAYIYQRSHISRVKAQVMKVSMEKMSRDDKDVRKLRDWSVEMEQLVGEMCWLCMHRNLVDKMLELPWQADEENIVQKCLLEQATRDPSSTAGNLMVVYYMMRCRNVEAYLVHKKLCSIEESFIGQCNDEVKSSCVRNICMQRALLVEKSIELLPEVQQNQLRSGVLDAKFSVSSVDPNKEIFSKQLEAEARIPALSESAQASLPVLPFPLNRKSELSHMSSRILPDTSMPVGWGDFRQPSILHGKHFKATSGGSTLFSPLNQTTFTGFARRESGEELMSPILGRKLIYNGETDSTCYPIQNTASTSDQEMLNVLDCRNDSTKSSIYEEDRDPQLLIPQHLPSESLGTNGFIGCVRSSANGEQNLENDCIRLNISERAQSGNFLLSENGESVTAASNCSPKLGFRETENGTQGNRVLLGEDPNLSLLSSPEIFKPRSRRHWLHSSPNGKRKAYDHLDAREPRAPSAVAAADGLGGLFKDDIIKASPNELHQGESSSEIEIATLRSQRNTGIRWRAEDGDMELPPSHSLPASKVKLSNMGRTIGGSRSFRNHAL